MMTQVYIINADDLKKVICEFTRGVVSDLMSRTTKPENTEVVYLTHQELLSRLKLSDSTVRKLVDKGDIPFITLGRKKLYDVKVVDEFVKSNSYRKFGRN